ncbi:hypothetical protein RJ641_031189, partial [Dillenia turbinata]
MAASTSSASSFIVHNNNLLTTSSSFSTKCYTNRTLALNPSQFLSSNSLLMLKKQSLSPKTPIPKLIRNRKSYSPTALFPAQSDFLRDSIPRPIARISVTMAILAVAWICKWALLVGTYGSSVYADSVLVCMLKLITPTFFFYHRPQWDTYFVFTALNKDDGPKGDGGNSSTEDTLEEARRIMEKY